MKKTVLCAIALSFGLAACGGGPREFRRYYNIHTGEQFCEDKDSGKKFDCELPPPKM